MFFQEFLQDNLRWERPFSHEGEFEVTEYSKNGSAAVFV